MFERDRASISQYAHALVEFLRPRDGPGAEYELAAARAAFHALDNNFRVWNHPALGVAAGEPTQLRRVGDLIKRGKLDPVQRFIQAGRRRETRLSASRRRDLGQVEAFHDGSCQRKKVIEFRARRRWQVIPGEVRAQSIPGVEERL